MRVGAFDVPHSHKLTTPMMAGVLPEHESRCGVEAAYLHLSDGQYLQRLFPLVSLTESFTIVMLTTAGISTLWYMTEL